MQNKILKRIIMVCMALLLCVCMVQGAGTYVYAKEVSYTSQDGISVGDKLNAGSVLPWPVLEKGYNVSWSYVFIYQDAGRGGLELFACLPQNKNEGYVLPSYGDIKNMFWLYMPEGETFSHWEVMDISATINDREVTFFWKIKLVRKQKENTDTPGTPATQVPETPATQIPETPATQVPETPATQIPETPATQVPEIPAIQIPDTDGKKPGTESNNNTNTPAGPGQNVSQYTTITDSGTYDLTAGTTYILNGPSSVGGDSTLYAKGIRFQVKQSGNYSFQ